MSSPEFSPHPEAVPAPQPPEDLESRARKSPRKASRRRTPFVVLPIAVAGLCLVSLLPVQAHVEDFMLNRLPLNRLALIASKGAGRCSLRGAWAGYGELVATKEASERVAANSRLRRVDPGGFQEWESPLGVFWFPKGAEAWTIHFALDQYERGAYPGAPVRAGDVVIDCGGYVGDWTKWALKAGAAQAVIIEPAPASLECLRRNLDTEIRQGRVTLIAKGVWDRQDTLQLKLDEANPAANSVSAEKPARGETIELTTLDQIVESLGLARVDCIKMDIEGAETRALRGARKTLNRFRPRLAVATEHTSSVLANNQNVIQAIREVAPFYRMECGYCAPTKNGTVPETLYFLP
jgi:FkbM family methyltransferase